MKLIPESSPSNRAWQFVRWICVLPAALICAAAIDYIGRMVGLMAATVFGNTWDIMYWVHLAMFRLPKNAAFVLAGAMTAPRYRVPTAVGLAAIASGLALQVHVLLPSTPGWRNYTDFAAESAGAACGVIFLALALRRQWLLVRLS